MCMLLVFTMLLPAEAKAAPKLNKQSVTPLLKGKSCTIKLKGTDKKATWNTTKRAVAKIVKKNKASAKIQAVKKGKAVITAKVNGKTYQCRIRVVDPKLNKATLSLTEGQSSTLKVSGGTGTIKWKTSNQEVATVKNGKVVAKEAGVAVITAVQNKRKMTCTVKVANKAEDQENPSSAENTGSQPKRIWVVTKRAETVYIPVYDEVPYIECLTCGAIFEGKDAGERAEKYSIHASAHMKNGEEARSSAKVRKTLIRTDTIYYPEEGYWKEI